MAKRLAPTPVSTAQHALDLVRGALVPVHRGGWPFVGAGLAVALLGWRWRPVRRLGLAGAGAMAFFFRSPQRTPPTAPGLVVAPADGEVCLVDTAPPPAEAGLGEAVRPRVSIFLSLTDVHVQRAPVAGQVVSVTHTPGAFASADLPEASETNERTVLVLRTPQGAELACVQVAGLIARRIITQAAPGDELGRGAVYGLIRFGSRVDLYLPQGTAVDILPGQRTIGGETVLGRLP